MKMINKLFILIILFGIGQKAFTQEITERFWFEIDERKLKEEERRLYLEDSMLSSERDDVTGVDLKQYDTNADNRKIGFGYQSNADLRDATGISTFEFHYAIRRDWYWLEFHFARTTATNREILTFNPNVGTPSDDLYDETSSINEFGIGLSTRTKYIQLFYNSPDVFEIVGATLNYVSLSEPFFGTDYSGFGIKADYAMTWRLASSYHIGLKGSYHLASVKRERINDKERSFQRSQVIDWFALGIDMTFYY